MALAAYAVHVRVGPAQALHLGVRPTSGIWSECLVASPLPWVLPTVWPPAVSAAVSSSFMAMRAKVSRTWAAVFSGSGLPFDALRVDVDQAHLHRGQRVLHRQGSSRSP